MIDKELLLEIGRYIFDGLLVGLIWVETNFTLLSTSANSIWIDTFGEYAQIFKLSFQVLITVIIAVTAFYRMLIMRRKYRSGKNNKEE